MPGGPAGRRRRPRSRRAAWPPGSTGMSWPVISRFSRRIWIGWTVVATTVRRSILPASQQQPVLEVREAAALAEPRALEVHGHRAGQHQVELRHLVEVDHLPWRSAPLIVAASRSCSSSSLRGSSRRNGCWSRRRGTAITSVLPCVEREPARVGLRGVGVRLDRLGAPSRPGGGRAARRRPWRRRSWGSGPRRPGSATRPRDPSSATRPGVPGPSCASRRASCQNRAAGS